MDNDYVIDNAQARDEDRYTVRYIWHPEHGNGEQLYVTTGVDDEPPWINALADWGTTVRVDHVEAFNEWEPNRNRAYLYDLVQIKYDDMAVVEVEEIDENNEDLDEFLKCFVLKEANS